MKRLKWTFLGGWLILAGCQHTLPRDLDRCLGTAAGENRQAVVVTEKGTGAPSGVLIRLYERTGEGWLPASAPMDGMAGRNGLAQPGEKREGDGRTPSGIFPLERGFGYGPLETKIPYLVLGPETVWIDDPKSPRYNTLATRKEGKGVSFEIMKRGDDLYKYGIVVEYNTRRVEPGRGSAIFFHIWRDAATSTAGCIAAAEEDILRLLHWLDPEKNPVAIIGTAGCPGATSP